MKGDFSVLTAFLLITFFQAEGFCNITKDNTKEIEANLIHADTYHWLSRTRGNDLIDAEKRVVPAKQCRWTKSTP